jgi:hypothetical protein
MAAPAATNYWTDPRPNAERDVALAEHSRAKQGWANGIRQLRTRKRSSAAATAHHEAGHVLLGRLFHRHVSEVCMLSDFGGYTDFESMLTLARDASAEVQNAALAVDALICMGGMAAEHQYLRQYAPELTADDSIDLVFGGASDLQEITSRAFVFGEHEPEEQTAADVARLKRLAEDIIKFYWPVVEDVAAALQSARRLTREDIHMLTDKGVAELRRMAYGTDQHRPTLQTSTHGSGDEPNEAETQQTPHRQYQDDLEQQHYESDLDKGERNGTAEIEQELYKNADAEMAKLLRAQGLSPEAVDAVCAKARDCYARGRDQFSPLGSGMPASGMGTTDQEIGGPASFPGRPNRGGTMQPMRGAQDAAPYGSHIDDGGVGYHGTSDAVRMTDRAYHLGMIATDSARRKATDELTRRAAAEGAGEAEFLQDTGIKIGFV